MTVKKTREEVAYEYLKDCGPCLITYEDNEKVKILLSSTGEIFWLNDESGPYIPYITLSEVLAEAKPLLLTLFTANIQEELNSSQLYQIEDELRASLSSLFNKKELSKDEVREIKIKFLDVKEEILESGSVSEEVVEDASSTVVKTSKEIKNKNVETSPVEVVETKETLSEKIKEEVKSEPIKEITGDIISEDEDPFKQ